MFGVYYPLFQNMVMNLGQWKIRVELVLKFFKLE